MEPWLEEQHRQKRWDDWLKQRPVCCDCGNHIARETYLPTPDGPLCPECVGRRMVEVGEE